jgi:hypothetical protein
MVSPGWLQIARIRFNPGSTEGSAYHLAFLATDQNRANKSLKRTFVTLRFTHAA